MRQSHFIGRKRITNNMPAVRQAEKMGYPLNYCVTIHFSSLPDEEISPAFAWIRDARFGPWLRRPSKKKPAPVAPPVFIWCLENPAGRTHAHWMVHIPDGRLRDFEERLARWIEEATGEPCLPGIAKIQKLYHPKGKARYLAKGINPVYAAFYGIEHKPQGMVIGKRMGFSKTLGPTRCREAETYWSDMVRNGTAYRVVFPREDKTPGRIFRPPAAAA